MVLSRPIRFYANTIDFMKRPRIYVGAFFYKIEPENPGL